MKQTLVRGQDARDFTVRVQHLKTRRTVGTGFVVSTDGKIITCAHVVVAAGVNPLNGRRIPTTWELSIASLGFGGGTEIPAADHIGIYFPQLKVENRFREARVIAAFPDSEDDIVLLQLVDGPSPLGPDRVARLGEARDSTDHRFNTFGYRRLGEYEGLPGLGTIVGLVDKPADRKLVCDRVMLTSQNIDSGMSGAAVLDRELNLVVGVIAETPDAIKKLPDRDTSIAVDALVFRSSPFDLPFHDGPFEPGPSPFPPPRPPANPPPGPPDALRWNNAPHQVEEWVGRGEILDALRGDYTRNDCYLSSIVGFGGEGKSCLLRRWVGNLLSDSSSSRPEGIFWWTFTTIQSADQFFEAAYDFVGGATNEFSEMTSPNARAHFIAAMLYHRRFVFVLDGVETLQQQQGDRFGELTNSALRELLFYFANGGHKSFGLLSSRVPFVELLPYSTHAPHELTRLTGDEGVALLKNLHLKGTKSELRKMVEEWDGHALTLTLLSTYLTAAHGGDVRERFKTPSPSAGEKRLEGVGRVLDAYIAYLSPAESLFLCIFSLFRKTVPESSFPLVFRKEVTAGSFREPLAKLSDNAFQALLNRLLSYRLLRSETSRKDFTTHPLIRSYFHSQTGMIDGAELRDLHLDIAGFYLNLYTSRGQPPEVPTLEDMKPLFESVHHGCAGGAYDRAWDVLYRLIDRGRKFLLTSKLGASDTGFELLQEFFPGGDTSKDPQVSRPAVKSAILNGVGVRLQDLGRLNESLSFVERALKITLELKEFVNVARDYMNLSEFHSLAGDLQASADAACQAIEFAKQTNHVELQVEAMTNLGWAQHLQGSKSEAQQNFETAEQMQMMFSGHSHLYALSGFWYTHFLLRAGNISLARTVTGLSFQIAKRNSWMRHISRGHTVFGILYTEEKLFESAGKHFEEALRIARGISYRPALMDALLGRARWAIRVGEFETAQSDLTEALSYATFSGYRIYEVDIRVAIAQMHLATARASQAKFEAEQAAQMSTEMGYHWGQVDAGHVLDVLGSLLVPPISYPWSSQSLPMSSDEKTSG